MVNGAGAPVPIQVFSFVERSSDFHFSFLPPLWDGVGGSAGKGVDSSLKTRTISTHAAGFTLGRRYRLTKLDS